MTVTTVGGGSVASAPGGIAGRRAGPSGDCSEGYLAGTIVTLMAVPDPLFVFGSFGSDAGCGAVVTLAASLGCTATFIPQFRLTVGPTGDGSGLIFSIPTGIACGDDCDELYTSGTAVTIVPVPLGGSIFTQFGGDADCGDGLLVLTAKAAPR